MSQKPINPNRDARMAAAFDRGDPEAALREFTREPEPPQYPIPDWCQCGRRVALRSDPSVTGIITNITGDPQHVYELTVALDGFEGEAPYKWLTNTGEPDFEVSFVPVSFR